MATWYFRQKQPGEKERNPVTGEYFDEEAIDRPAQALVREVIQNCLDARANGDTVKVRFYVSGKTAALPSERAARWLGQAWDHFSAEDSGLRNVPQPSESCPFLVVEDSSTIGLEGNSEAQDLQPGTDKNHFYAFFRAEGVSQNAGGRGKWGVGKTVFARSSQVNTLFGLTMRRSDKRRMLMGQSILRYHRVANKKYSPDGMFGIATNNDFVLPITDSNVLSEFCRDFGVQWRDEAGLSVVVPFCHDEIRADAIVKAVAREYFFPILTGKLTVVVEGPELNGVRRTLDSNSLLDSIDTDEGDIQGDLRSLLEFAIEEVITLPQGDRIRLGEPPPGDPPGWSDSLFPETVLAELRSRFARGKSIALRVPLAVRTASGDVQPSYFDVYMRQDLSGRGYVPVFIRNGIIIPKALERRVRGYRLLALVIIDDGSLERMLGDAETPAHTQWSHQTQNFRDKYQNGKICLDFVRSAPRQIAEILSDTKSRRDRLALADFFPRPPDDDGLDSTLERPREEVGHKTEQPQVNYPAPQPQPFEIEQKRGGFCIRRAARASKCPPRLEISVAYDRTRGNPLSKYHTADFRLEAMRKRMPGVREVACRENQLIVDVVDDEFRIEVTGFDENRDVYVRVRPMEHTND